MLSLGWGKCETLATSHDTHPHCVTLKYIYPVPNRWTDFEPRVTWLMTTEHPLNMRRYLSHGPEPEDHCFPRLSWPQCRDFMFNAHHSNHFQFTTITTLKCKLNALHVRLPSFWATYFAELWQIYHNRHSLCCGYSPPSFPECTAFIADVLTLTHSALLAPHCAVSRHWLTPARRNITHNMTNTWAGAGGIK